MKKIIIFILLLILTLSSFTASELDSLLKDDEDIYSELTTDQFGLEAKEVLVEKLVGQAFLQPIESDKWFQIVENASINEKDTIITMENSSIKVRLEDETFINVGSRTKLYFDTLRGKPEQELISETGLKLAWGKVFSSVRKKVEAGGKYEIEAGSVVAGVRGTQYTTELSRAGKISVKVYDGNVFVIPLEVHKKREIERKKNQGEKPEAGNTGEKKDVVDNKEVEVIVGANEVIVVSKDGDAWNIDTHNDSAPIEINETNDASDEIEDIKNELGLTEAGDTEFQETEVVSNVSDILNEVIQDAISTAEEQTGTTEVDVNVYIR